MLLMTGTSDLVRVVTTGATPVIECHASWLDLSAGVVTPGRTNTADITSATTTTIVGSPAGSTQRNVKHISIRNNDATDTEALTVTLTDGTTDVELMGVTLLSNESLIFDEYGQWTHYDVNGGVYPSVGNAATQAEMEAGTATNKYVTPQGVNWHPGVTKCWGKAVGAGTSLTVNWNIASIADTGTGRLGVTIGTDFSSAHYSIVASLERTVTALTATGVEDHAIRNASPTAGVFEIESYDQTAITFVAQDPANYYWQCCGDQT